MSTPNGDSPAFPCTVIQTPGLTKREEMAKAAMVGFLASDQAAYIDGHPAERCSPVIARAAVELADALLAELEKKL